MILFRILMSLEKLSKELKQILDDDGPRCWDDQVYECHEDTLR